MKLTVLVDNTTLIDQYYLGEPGLSFYIEDGGQKILFDCGYSDIFLRNAQKMQIDLMSLDTLVLSHSHLDHTWGLTHLIKAFTEERFAGRMIGLPHLVTHPRTFVSTQESSIGEIGSIVPLKRLDPYFRPVLTRDPFAITEHLIFLGEIPRVLPFEHSPGIGMKSGEDSPDTLLDDSALAYRSPEGLVIITGCSHSGICNIVQYAKQVCHDERIVDIIGGLHLLQPEPARLQGTVAYLKRQELTALHACHCTDLPSKIALAAAAPIREVGVGLTLSY
ncbi:MAG: MBL fold metallo-hydrolase [Spirochaetia bacterium]|nr:MBL fold metallo-hydrolase [Spirochaetia bacterium]